MKTMTCILMKRHPFTACALALIAPFVASRATAQGEST